MKRELVLGEGGEAAGLDAVVRNRPDLVLLDLQMPGMGGLTLLKHIREVESRVPIIVISATDDTKVAAEALRVAMGAAVGVPVEIRRRLASGCIG